MGKGEIARYEQFLLFPQCIQKASFPGASKGVIVWEWVKHIYFTSTEKQSSCNLLLISLELTVVLGILSTAFWDKGNIEVLLLPKPVIFMCMMHKM